MLNDARQLQVYTIYSILFIVFLILVVVTAFITVALTCEAGDAAPPHVPSGARRACSSCWARPGPAHASAQ